MLGFRLGFRKICEGGQSIFAVMLTNTAFLAFPSAAVFELPYFNRGTIKAWLAPMLS
jgi:hypothetical protein